MHSEKSANPFWLVLLTVVLLGLLSFLKPDLTVAGFEVRRVNLLSDVIRTEPLLASPPPAPAAGAHPADSTRLANNLGAAAETKPAVAANTLPVISNVAGLDSFLLALRQTKATGQKTRIAYFGDSMIEGDLITGDLRNQLQQLFGGEGVGFVPITSVTADFRGTIHQTFSENWRKYDLVTPKLPAQHPLGMSGHVFVAPAPQPATDSTEATKPAWVQFAAGGPFGPVRRFSQARLFYGPGNAQDQVAVTFGQQQSAKALSGEGQLNQLVFTANPTAKNLHLSFQTHASRDVYGVSFEGEQGVTLDNFAFRGNSGMSLTRIPRQMLNAFGKAQDYRLIILHYGVNVANAKVENYSFYERAMTRVIDRLQKACPHASILLVGMSDKSCRQDGEYTTDPSVPRLLAAQQRIAQRNHVGFWNLFEAMGGENTMVSWVEGSPALANKDYTHVNARGARKIAGLLSQYLMQEYQKAPATAAAPDSTAAAVAR
ncbi:GDSL-type esterase/lipase family protein [Hymenobacter aerilatus]|uniref:GDSL-type esterase/lipase family protein n=1 Tax=Hymenobacter aerilatus TaxID=2932251 RepID=A0A8T9T0T9_9BACT|nr:GDSL-type esterase/lipase family protein [Hymenobacter aerilatus]UOR06794.1 GDSL-type esterase/lipase family protein [Hymenobacter aerilatus]